MKLVDSKAHLDSVVFVFGVPQAFLVMTNPYYSHGLQWSVFKGILGNEKSLLFTWPAMKHIRRQAPQLFHIDCRAVPLVT